MSKFSELSDCELATMKCIWDAAEPVSAQEIMEQLKVVYGLEYKDTTVYTFIKKLREKGFVDSYRKGITYYAAIRSEEEYRSQQLRRTEDFWFKGSSSKLLSALVKTKKVSAEERRELRQVVDELGG